MKSIKILSLNDCSFGIGEVSVCGDTPIAPADTVVYAGERFINRFFYVTKGSITFELSDKKSFTAVEGDIVYLPYGAPYHSFWNDEENEYINLLFDMFDETGEKIIIGEKINVIYKDETRRFEENFRKMLRIYLERHFNWNLNLKSNLYNFLARFLYEISYNHEDSTGFRSQINKGIVYLENNYMKNIPVLELAEQSNVSESTFRRNFIKLKGMSPVAYRNDLRLQYAQDFLSSGLYNVTEVAELVGINDVPYFSKSFKKRFGITPTECVYQSKNREK